MWITTFIVLLALAPILSVALCVTWYAYLGELGTRRMR